MTTLVILAAGQGTRLRPLTDDRPKGMVQLAGQPLLAWQVATAQAAGLTDIVVVRGYRGERIDVPGVRFVQNEQFATTNMVYSLWCAREHLGDDVVVSYADIVYRPEVVGALLGSPHPVSVVVDRDWLSYWRRRFADPLADAETLKLDAEGRIRSVGERPEAIEEIEAQYIGLTRFLGPGAALLRETLAVEAAAFARGAAGLHREKRFDRLYMTDLLQALVDRGEGVHAVPVHGGWLEIDSLDDLRLAEELVTAREGVLSIGR